MQSIMKLKSENATVNHIDGSVEGAPKLCIIKLVGGRALLAVCGPPKSQVWWEPILSRRAVSSRPAGHSCIPCMELAEPADAGGDAAGAEGATLQPSPHVGDGSPSGSQPRLRCDAKPEAGGTTTASCTGARRDGGPTTPACLINVVGWTAATSCTPTRGVPARELVRALNEQGIATQLDSQGLVARPHQLHAARTRVAVAAEQPHIAWSVDTDAGGGSQHEDNEGCANLSQDLELVV